MTTANCHAYRPLQRERAIRIIVLAAGADDDPICCRLIHTELGDSTDPYAALSYEWGQPSDDDPAILLDGGPVTIRVNLWQVLRQIRDTEKDQSLWVDALCINQSNIPERNAQVKMMREIYSLADHVIAWLGPATDNSDLAMKLISDDRISDPQNLDLDEMLAVSALCNRPYGLRVWIMQEIFLARRYVAWCGSVSVPENQFSKLLGLKRSVPSQSLYRAWRGIDNSPAMAQLLTRHIGSTFRGGDRDPNNLRRWLKVCQRADFKATEPRDHIYALLSISCDCQNGEIVPDYEKPLMDVYLETLERCRVPREQVLVPDSFACRLGTKMGLDLEIWEMKWKMFIDGEIPAW